MANQKIESKDGKMLTLPSFANVYTMQGVQEANSKNDWWGWKIDLHNLLHFLSFEVHTIDLQFP